MGVYTCIAENENGSDQAAVFLYPVSPQYVLKFYNSQPHCAAWSNYVGVDRWHEVFLYMNCATDA